MIDIDNSIFGSLDKSNCLFFYYVSVFSFIFMVIAIILVFIDCLKPEIHKPIDVMNGVYIVILYFSSYISNRLLYSMCINGKI